MQAAFDAVAPRLRSYAPELHDALAAYLKEPKSPEAPAAKLEAFLANVPEGYYPLERLTKVLERVRAQAFCCWTASASRSRWASKSPPK